MSQAAPEIPVTPLPLAPAPSAAIRFGPFLFERDGRQLQRDGKSLDVPPRALALLSELLARPGRVVAKRQLMDAVWPDAVVSETSLTEAVSLLRQALGDDAQQPAYVQTVNRRGYRFLAPLEPAEPRSRPAARWPVAVAIAAALAAGVGAGLAWRAGEPEPAPLRARFSIPLELGDATGLKAPSALAVSPDGRELVYVGRLAEGTQLLRRRLDSFEVQPIPGTAWAAIPFFSPDGRWIGFHADGRLKKLRLEGGEPIGLTETGWTAGACWGDDGYIYFGREHGQGIGRVPESGGAVETVTRLDSEAGELGHYWPELLPGGRTLLFTRWFASGLAHAEVAALTLATGEQRTLAKGSAPHGLPGARLLFVERGALKTAGFDAERLELTTPALSVLDGVQTSWFHGAAQLALTRRAGTLVYAPGDDSVPLHTVQELRGADAAPRTLVGEKRPFMNLSLEPGARRAALTVHEGRGADLWLAELASGALTRLTDEAHNIEPAWSSQGQLAFASSRSGPYNLYALDPDAPDPPRRLLESPHNQYPEDWTRDGRQLLFTELRSETGSDLWLLDTPTGVARPLLATRFDEESGALSPDGSRLAWSSNESGRYEVYTAPFPELRPRLRVSREGGEHPRWSPDGRRLLWLSAGGLLEVDVPDSPGQRPGAPRRIRDADRIVAWAPTRDGVVVISGAAGVTRSPQLHVVLGWLAELAERAGSGG